MHAHISIAYTNEDGSFIEELRGFDPGITRDRQLVHGLLDEYLDRLDQAMLDARTRRDGEGRIDLMTFGKIDPDNRKDWPEATESMGGFFVSPYFHE
jgi:hypothetical protein